MRSSIASHRATADVALLQLAEPIANRPPAVIGVPNEPFQVGSSYTIAGVGVAKRGDGRTGGVIREAELESTSRPGRLQIRLLDPGNRERDRRPRRLHRRFRWPGV